MLKEIKERRAAFANATSVWNKDDGEDRTLTIQLGEDVLMAAVAMDAGLVGELHAATQLLKGVLLADVLNGPEHRDTRAQVAAFLKRHEAL